MLFKEAHQDLSSSYLMGHKFIPLHQHSMQTVGEGQGQILDVSYRCKNHPCKELCFAHFHAKIQNIKKKKRKKAHCEVNTQYM